MMTTLWSGLTMGAIYAIVAVGYNITLILSGVLNFASSQFIAIGAFVAYWGLTQNNIPLPLVIAIAVVIAGGLAFLEERIAVRPLRKSGNHIDLITTLGASTIISGVLLLLYGPEPLQVRVLPNATWEVLGGQVRPNELVLIAVAIVATVAVHFWIHRSRLGLAGLARAEDSEAASIRGMNVRALAILGFVAAGAFGGLIGPIVAQKTFAVATLGLVLALKGFVAMAVGGVGSILGSLVGGLIVGLVEAFAARYIGSDFGQIAVVIVLFAMLLLRPSGVLGRGQARLV
ncbi:branched-chain amino acid ABC transporter permease [Glaciibacter sp. 2TAF33]|uniref:branched-chain amino acid ABC transporter permease n=1 Tax=Glaciibacter sp. 2TAF33 TaxID=3233015 RepID=UPI003F9129F4